MSTNGTQESQTSHPRTSRIRLYGVDYEVDLDACRTALAARAIELRAEMGGTASGFELVAQAAGVDRKTLSRFLAGDRVQVDTFADIVTRGLRLAAADVLRKIDPEAVPA